MRVWPCPGGEIKPEQEKTLPCFVDLTCGLLAFLKEVLNDCGVEVPEVIDGLFLKVRLSNLLWCSWKYCLCSSKPEQSAPEYFIPLFYFLFTPSSSADAAVFWQEMMGQNY